MVSFIEGPKSYRHIFFSKLFHFSCHRVPFIQDGGKGCIRSKVV